MSNAIRKIRQSNPSTESTWCVVVHERDEKHARVDSYHDMHDEALACAEEMLNAQATASEDEIPYVLVCKIHNQNGDL